MLLQSCDLSVPKKTRFPYTLPLFEHCKSISFISPVTFLIGENGTGKSTLLESLAVAAKCVSIGSEDLHTDKTLDHAREIASCMRLAWKVKRARSYFLRAEDVFGFAKRMHDLQNEVEEQIASYDGTDLGSIMARGFSQGQKRAITERYSENPDAFSHGDFFFQIFESRFIPDSLYILDEPEAPLSFQRQLAFLLKVREMVEKNCQFIIATHSPILASFPGSSLLLLKDNQVQDVQYEDIEQFEFYRDFLNNKNKFLQELFK